MCSCWKKKTYRKANFRLQSIRLGLPTRHPVCDSNLSLRDCNSYPLLSPVGKANNMFQLIVTPLLEWDLWSDKYWNQNCDPRTVNFWLMNGGPWKVLAISFAYLLIIVIGIRWMRNRKPFNIRLPMFIYNLGLVLTNCYFLYKSFWWIDYGKDLLNFRFPSPHDCSSRAESLIKLFYYYHLSKFIDYFDTFFFVLRKKNRHISVLHVYHHVSVPIVGWLSNWVSMMDTPSIILLCYNACITPNCR